MASGSAIRSHFVRIGRPTMLRARSMGQAEPRRSAAAARLQPPRPRWLWVVAFGPARASFLGLGAPSARRGELARALASVDISDIEFARRLMSRFRVRG